MGTKLKKKNTSQKYSQEQSGQLLLETTHSVAKKAGTH
jgi:hypothetical protein